MTTLQERVAAHFAESIKAKQQAAEVLVEPTAQAAELLLACLMNDGRFLICGNGGSAADAQHFAAEMTGRFEKERMELAAIALTTDTSALTAIGNDYGFEHIFSKQVRALGRAGDVLVGISTSGHAGHRPDRTRRRQNRRHAARQRHPAQCAVPAYRAYSGKPYSIDSRHLRLYRHDAA